MLQQTNQSFREYFLLEFTKEILRSTKSYKSIAVKKITKKIARETHEKRVFLPTTLKRTYEIPNIPEGPRIPLRKIVHEIVKDKTKRDSKRLSKIKKKPLEKLFRPEEIQREMPLPALRIPELTLPETVSYLRPVIGQRQISLGKLDPLVRDPLVRTMECIAPNQKIIVTGAMGRRTTPIMLNKEEIDDVINRFSMISKIPAQEGIFKVVVGNLIISAIISNIVGSKFIITKMIPQEFY